MEIQELWRILRERWLIVAITTLLFVIGSLAWYFFRPLEYQAQTRVVVSTSGGTGTAVDAYAGERVAQLRTPSYSELLKGPEVAARASSKLNGEVSPSDIQDAISTRIAPDQPLINVTAESTNPNTALRIVEAVQESFQAYVAEIERPGATGALTSVEIATDQPTVRPNGHWKRDTAIAGVIGLIVGMLLAVIRDRTDPVVRKPGQLSVAGLPYLGTVRRQEQHSGDSLEVFRRITLECLINSRVQPTLRLLVAGVDPESDSAVVARGMAEALASYDKKITLIDVKNESHEPGYRPGLSDYFAGMAEWGAIAIPSDMPNISEVGSGSDGHNLDAYFMTGRLPEVPLPLRRGEYAVFAAPSIAHTPVAVSLTALADCGLLVATSKSSRLADLDEARHTLEAMGTPLLGVVLLEQPRQSRRKSVKSRNDSEAREDEIVTRS
jgi:capsular polysaccharide biosynthesis protein/Mrp family chromosome partitioning ATPase